MYTLSYVKFLIATIILILRIKKRMNKYMAHKYLTENTTKTVLNLLMNEIYLHRNCEIISQYFFCHLESVQIPCHEIFSCSTFNEDLWPLPIHFSNPWVTNMLWYRLFKIVSSMHFSYVNILFNKSPILTKDFISI